MLLANMGVVSNREALLEAAITCLQTKGYARTTARDLVLASNTNLGAIGYHFGSKDALLNEAIAEAYRRWVTPLIAETLAEQGSSPERLLRAFSEVISSVDENRPMLAAAHEALAQVDRSERVKEQLAASYDDARETLAMVLKAVLGKDGHPMAAEHSTALASLLIALFDGIIIQRRIDSDRAPSGEIIKQILQVLTQEK